MVKNRLSVKIEVNLTDKFRIVQEILLKHCDPVFKTGFVINTNLQLAVKVHHSLFSNICKLANGGFFLVNDKICHVNGEYDWLEEAFFPR